MENIILISLLFYLASFASYIKSIINKRELNFYGQFTLWIAFILHTSYFVLKYSKEGCFSVNSIVNALPFYAWMLVFLTGVITLKYKVKTLNFILLPIAMILLVVKIFLKEVQPQEIYFSNLWLLVHTTLTFLGYAGFTAGFVCAILYLWQERKIKKHASDILSSKTVPALQIVDNLGYQSIKIGFLFLTGGMIVGAFWLGNLEGVYWSGSFKEIFSVITWFTYAILLHLHIFGFFRGKKIAWIIIASFVFMIFSFIGINLLFPTNFHN